MRTTLTPFPLQKVTGPCSLATLTKQSAIPLYLLSSAMVCWACWSWSRSLTRSMGAVIVLASAAEAPPARKSWQNLRLVDFEVEGWVDVLEPPIFKIWDDCFEFVTEASKNKYKKRKLKCELFYIRWKEGENIIDQQKTHKERTAVLATERGNRGQFNGHSKILISRKQQLVFWVRLASSYFFLLHCHRYQLWEKVKFKLNSMCNRTINFYIYGVQDRSIKDQHCS